MSHINIILDNLHQFIKRYYTNALLKGSILFFVLGLLYLFFTLFLEYVLWLNPIARTFLFWLFIGVEFILLIKFIILPLLFLFRLQQGINYEVASKLIGSHFPEVNDKLLNLIQLNKNKVQSDLLLASIAQKSKALQPIPFSKAISFSTNIKYLKYAAIPICLLLFVFVTGQLNEFNDSYNRVINYQTAYEPPAPFQFFVLNTDLQTIEDKVYNLNVSTVGNVVPEHIQIHYNNTSYFLQPSVLGEFQYQFKNPKQSIVFSLSANGIRSKLYTLNVLASPKLVNFEMRLEYPKHTNKINETLKSTGSASIPEGTTVTWNAQTKSTTQMSIYALDTLHFKTIGENDFSASKQLFNSYNYTINTSNTNLIDYENLTFSLAVIKDNYPALKVEVQIDSIDKQSLYFFGQATDDYGLKNLNLVYYPSDQSTIKEVVSIPISKSNFSEFISTFPNTLNLTEGVSYSLYFEVFDSDRLHNYKRTKSPVFTYRKSTSIEKAENALNNQNTTIKNLSNSFDKLDQHDTNLKELSIKQKEKQILNFTDKKKFEDFLKRQTQQDQLMKSFNKKLQDNLDEYQIDDLKQDKFKDDLKARLKENEAQLKKDEQLLEDIKKLQNKINKEEFSQKLDELAKQNKNKKRSMKQLLELTKRFYVTKKAEKLQNKVEALSIVQEALSKKEKANTKEAQIKINSKFVALQKELNALGKDNSKLHKPIKIDRDKVLEDMVKFDQQKAKELLEYKINTAKDNKNKASKKQQDAANKLKEISDKLKIKSSSAGGGSQTAEDIETLRQILDNLLLYSFEQEELMFVFKNLNTNNNSFGAYIVQQHILKTHFEHVDDSLFALSLRQPKLSNKVNTQITDVYFNLDKSLDLLSENKLYEALSSQQYAITGSNELANILSNVLDNMEMSMQPSSGSGDEGMQLPDIIMSQEALNKKMQDALKSKDSGKEGKEGTDGKEGKTSNKGKEGENGSEGSTTKTGNQGKKGANEGQANTIGEAKNGKTGSIGNKPTERITKNTGYGEGGNEEQNALLYKIYQSQQLLRKALQDNIVKDNTINTAGALIRQMEDIELDLLNSGFTNQTLQKMMDLQHQLLKLDKATFTQGQDSKRTSKTSNKNYSINSELLLLKAKQYFNTTEILNRQALPLQNHFKQKVKVYFNNSND